MSLSMSDSALTTSTGQCPRCAVSVVWAFAEGEPPRRVLLNPESAVPVSAPVGSTVVVASVAGRWSLASPWVFRMHACSPGVATKSIGDYTEHVLSHPCPLDSCLVPPGEMCVSLRYEALPRPHGVRVALANGKSWSNDESAGSENLS